MRRESHRRPLPAARRAIAVAALAAGLAALPGCGSGGDPGVVLADDIPVAHTPPGVGGYGEVMPAPILARCTEPLVPGAPDLRGLWQTEDLQSNGAPAPADHPLWDHVERVEQCGDRLVVTSGGIIHDMRCDGTFERGVHDVSGLNWQPIDVIATFEDGVHVLRPVGAPGVEVTRARDGAAMIWHYLGGIVVRLRRIDERDRGA